MSIAPIQQVYEIDSGDVVKLCPRLKHNGIYPSHFEKMNVGLSVALLNHDVSAAILYHIAENKIALEHRTTAWFIETIYRWFKITIRRFHTYALSLKNEDVYNENIEFLKSVQNIIYHMSVNHT